MKNILFFAKLRSLGDVKGLAIGADGGEVDIEMSLDEVTVDNLDVLLFIDGSGCLRHLDNEKSYRIARGTFSKGVMLSAICISSVILAKTGLLDGREATVWIGSIDRSAVKISEDHGAKLRDESVVVTGKGGRPQPFYLENVLTTDICRFVN